LLRLLSFIDVDDRKAVISDQLSVISYQLSDMCQSVRVHGICQVEETRLKLFKMAPD
jgi:hypothetical protein